MTADASPSRTLNGWKEIAAHLRKSVRSVQRWERELALPVHRINTPDRGQIVYADSREIDAWLKRMDNDHASRHEWGVSDVSPLAEGEGQPSPVGVERRLWLGAAIAGVIGLTALVTSIRFGEAGPPPAAFDFEGRELLATAADGRVLWRYDFDEPVGPPNEFEQPGQRVIADDTGGYVVPVRFGPRGGRQPAKTDRVVAFDRDGRVRWQVAPEIDMSMGDRSFSGPWHARAVVTGTGQYRGRTWIAYKHHTWLPGFVLDVQDDGRSFIRYAQAGWVTSLALWQHRGRTELVAGGTSNEHQLASLAFIDLDGAASQGPPSAGPRLSCSGCPSRQVAAFLLFPPSEVGPRMGAPYAFADAIVPLASSLKMHFDDSRVAFVEAGPRVTSLDFSDAYWAWHLQAEEKGVINHAVEACPDRTSPKTVRVWTATDGWGTTEIAPTGSLSVK